MAIGYVGKGSVVNTVSGTAVNVPMPSGLAAGHRIYVLIGSIGSNSGTVTDPAGWTKIGEEVTGSNLRTALYAKTAVAADVGSTVTWTFPSAGRTFGYSLAYSGVDLAASDLAQANSTTTAGTGPWSTASLALNSGDWLLTSAVGRQNPGTSGTHDWTNATAADVERHDLYADVGTSITIAAAQWDSGAGVAAGSHSRSISSNVSYSQIATWALRIPALADAAPTGGNPWSSMGMPLR